MTFIPSLFFSNTPSFNRHKCDYKSEYKEYRIEEDDQNYYIEMDMAGVKKDNLEIGIKENILSISGKRNKLIKQENREDKEEIISSYKESFNINTKIIDIDNIKAALEDGVLTLTIPKKEEVKYEKKIEIA